VANANILLDHNTHDWDAVYNGGYNAKIFVGTGSGQFSGVTVQNSSIRNGNLDGVHLGGAGVNLLNNVFANLCDTGTNHTDNVQYEGGTGGRIAGNYFYAGAGCATQGITSYDGGTNGVTIEDNVVDIRRPWGIELYADRNSVVRHNTVRWYPDAECFFNGVICGQIDINRKSADPAGSGTQVYDNLTTRVSFSNGSTGTAHHNVSGQLAIYVGPTNAYHGFALASISPVGIGTASDGLNNGIRLATTPTPTPTPPPTPPPTSDDTPAEAIWTAPTGKTVGTPVVLDGTASTGDDPLSCTWSFENSDGSILWEPPITGCTIQKTFQYAGMKYVKLTVRDADGDTDSDKQSFAVSPSGATPTPTQPHDIAADAIWTAPTGARVGTQVTLDGSRSTGDAPITCTWTFENEDGSIVWEPPVSGCTIQKTFQSAGTKYVTLTVTDADGDTHSRKESFMVGPR
jgi:hypothetical protein